MTRYHFAPVLSAVVRFILWREVQWSLQSTAGQAKQSDKNDKRSEDVFHVEVARKFKSVSIIAGEDTKQEFAAFLQRELFSVILPPSRKQE